MLYGIHIALITVFLFAGYDVFNRFAILNLGAAPWQFALWQLIFASLTLLTFSGFGHQGLSTLKHPYTWGIGLARVTSIVLFLPALAHITATEANLLLKLNIFIAMALAYALLNRTPNKKDFIGFSAIILGLFILIMQQQGGFFSAPVWLIFGASIAITIATFLTELHPISNKSLGVKARCRYTAVILLVISIIFLISSLLLAQISPTVHAYVTTQGTTNLSTFILAALVAGIFIRAPLTYYTFLSIRLIKSENFLMCMSLIPFITLSLESILTAIGVFPKNSITNATVFAAFLITCGAMFNILHRLQTHQQKAIQQKDNF